MKHLRRRVSGSTGTWSEVGVFTLLAGAVAGCGILDDPPLQPPPPPVAEPGKVADQRVADTREASAPSSSGGVDGGAASDATSAYEASAGPATASSCGDRDAALPLVNMEKVMRSLVFPRVKSCYARALASEKQEGRLVMRLRVEASGRVSGADVKESQGLSAGIAKCAQEAALATRFPCTAAGGTIDVPFNFTLDASAP